MKTVWHIINTIAVCLFSVALFTYYCTTKLNDPELYLFSKHTDILIIISISLFLFLMNVFFAFLVYKQSEDETIRFSNQDGEITISTSAIEEALARAASEIPEVYSMKVKLHIEKGPEKKMRINAIGTTLDQKAVYSITQLIQKAMKERLDQMLQLDYEVSFNVTIQRFVKKSPVAKTNKAPKLPKPDQEQPTTAFPINYSKYEQNGGDQTTEEPT